MRETWQHDFELDVQAEPSLRAWPDSDRRRHRRVIGNRRPPLCGDELHRTEKARGISHGKKLLGIVARTTSPTKRAWRSHCDHEAAIFGGGASVAPSRCHRLGGIKYVYWHGW